MSSISLSNNILKPSEISAPLNKWLEMTKSESVSSLSEIEEMIHNILISQIPIKEKIEFYRSANTLFSALGDTPGKEPSLPCSVTDAYTTLNIEIPLSVIDSWHYFQQLYSGGYIEEERTHLSIKLPPEFTIDAFEALLRPIDIKAKRLSFEDFLAICELGSFLDANTSFTHLETFEPSIENIRLCIESNVPPSFIPYRQAVSSLISRYLSNSSKMIINQCRIRIHDILWDLENLPGFKEWAEEFPLDLKFQGYHRLTEMDLPPIKRLFKNIEHLELTRE